MKRIVLIALVVIALLCLGLVGLVASWLYNNQVANQLAHQRMKVLAQSVADALGRTSANSIVEYEAYDPFLGVYKVYFYIPDGSTEMNARLSALTALKLHVSSSGAGGGGPTPRFEFGAKPSPCDWQIRSLCRHLHRPGQLWLVAAQ
jgi:hypothetical protein